MDSRSSQCNPIIFLISTFTWLKNELDSCLQEGGRGERFDSGHITLARCIMSKCGSRYEPPFPEVVFSLFLFMKQGWILEKNKGIHHLTQPLDNMCQEPWEFISHQCHPENSHKLRELLRIMTAGEHWIILLKNLNPKTVLRTSQVYTASFPIFIMSHNRFRDCCTPLSVLFTVSVARMRHPKRKAKCSLWKIVIYWTPSYFISQFARHSSMFLQVAAAVKENKSRHSLDVITLWHRL